MVGMKTLLLCTVLAAAGATASFAAVEDEVKAAEAQWAAAAKSADAGKLQSLLSNDLVYTHSSGIIDDKTSYLAKLTSNRQKYEGIEHTNMKVRVYNGDAAVVTARVRMHGTNQSGPFDDQLLMTHVWVKVNGAWRLAAHQTTKVQ